MGRYSYHDEEAVEFKHNRAPAPLCEEQGKRAVELYNSPGPDGQRTCEQVATALNRELGRQGKAGPNKAIAVSRVSTHLRGLGVLVDVQQTYGYQRMQLMNNARLSKIRGKR